MRLIQRLFRLIPRVEGVAAMVFVLLGVFIFLGSRPFPDLPWRFGGSPAFFPRILSMLLFLLAPAMVWEARRRPAGSVLPPRGKRVVMMFVLLCLYIMPTVLLPYLGFPLAAFLFLLAVMLALLGWRVNYKQALELAGIALLMTAIIYVSFSYLAKVRLPKGVLFRWP